jgi:hypothetical protein
MTDAVQGQTWRNRITGAGEADPAALLPNPRNWRRHPSAQAAALEGVLSEVGWVASVIVNARTGHLVDGHLRVAQALRRKQASIPVTYVDLSAEEEAVILASLDPLAGMAKADPAALDALLREVTVQDAALRDMLVGLAADLGLSQDQGRGLNQAPGDFPEVGEDLETEHECPKCGYRWSGGH